MHDVVYFNRFYFFQIQELQISCQMVEFALEDSEVVLSRFILLYAVPEDGRKVTG